MQFTIQIIKVSPEVDKGKWKTFEVAFKKDGKVEGKPFFSFKYPDVYKILLGATEGETYTVTSNKEPGKDGKDYWQWTGIVSGGDVGQAEAVGPVSTGTQGSGAGASEGNGSVGVQSNSKTTPNSSVGRVTGSNYETAAERAIRQRLIVRQSSITAALDLMKHNAPKAVLDLDAVLAIASRFEDHVFRPQPE